MAKVEIYSAQVCPFAQRSRLTLLEKGVDFEVIEIDLNHKPDWFQSVSPYLKVPVVKVGDDRVWESSIINEYLEEVFPEPPLMPQTPGLRAIARIWIDFANSQFIPAFYKLLMAQEGDRQREWATQLTAHLRFLEYEGLRKTSQGPFWLGDRVSLVDLTYAPWFERWSALSHYRGIKIPAEYTRLHQWWQAMQARPSMQATQQPAEFHIAAYEKYANDTATGITAQELRRT
jgi:glutathione S-transferase